MEHPALKTSGLDDRHELKELYEQDRTTHHLQIKQPFPITYSVVNPPALPP
jgi:hypothetical protein